MATYYNTLKSIIFNLFDKYNKIILITEPKNWVISHISNEINFFIKLSRNNKVAIRLNARYLKNKIIHFQSLHTVLGHKNMLAKLKKRNKIIATIYHVASDQEILPHIPLLIKTVDVIHTSCQLTRNKLVALGIPSHKIVCIPQGINLQIFKKYQNSEHEKLKHSLQLPQNRFIIGSFQKDGTGWGEGNVPKMIKGPDIFIEVVKKIAQKHSIHILLTGPARGYVMNKLSINNISYTHRFLKNKNDLVNFYNSIDLYLICSRIEGGPQAVLESWSTGVPLVTTRVGIVPDIVDNDSNGLISDVNNIENLTKNALRIIENQELRNKLISSALHKVIKYDWKTIIGRYIRELYSINNI